MRVRTPPWECSLRTAVSPRLVATAQQSYHGECRPDYMAFHAPGRGFESRPGRHYGRVAQLDRAGMSGQHLVAVNLFKLANADATTFGYGPQGLRFESAHVASLLVASARYHRRMPAGLQVRAPASSAGGRRSDSASGKPDSSGKRLARSRRRYRQSQRGECRWDYTDLRVAGSNPAGLRLVAQR